MRRARASSAALSACAASWAAASVVSAAAMAARTSVRDGMGGWGTGGERETRPGAAPDRESGRSAAGAAQHAHRLQRQRARLADPLHLGQHAAAPHVAVEGDWLGRELVG